MKNKKQPTQEEYAALGRAIQKVMSSDYFNVIQTRRSFLWVHFLKGIVTGLGGVIGATVVVALVLWCISLLGHVPFLGSIIESTKETLGQ